MSLTAPLCVTQVSRRDPSDGEYGSAPAELESEVVGIIDHEKCVE